MSLGETAGELGHRPGTDAQHWSTVVDAGLRSFGIAAGNIRPKLLR
jgi:hypothetical protein